MTSWFFWGSISCPWEFLLGYVLLRTLVPVVKGVGTGQGKQVDRQGSLDRFMQVMNQLEAFYKALCWVTGEGTDCGSGGDPPPRLTFDLDVRVHVFEVTIRALGGLLSAHQLLTQVIVVRCGHLVIMHCVCVPLFMIFAVNEGRSIVLLMVGSGADA